MFLNPDGTWVEAQHGDGRGKIVDLEKKKVLLKREHTKSMWLNSDKTKAIVVYKNGRAKIIDLKEKKVLFEGGNIV